MRHFPNEGAQCKREHSSAADVTHSLAHRESAFVYESVALTLACDGINENASCDSQQTCLSAILYFVGLYKTKYFVLLDFEFAWEVKYFEDRGSHTSRSSSRPDRLRVYCVCIL